MLEGIVPKIGYEESSDNYGKFVVEPLSPGFGVTLGNSLRRVLLSSLPGAAVTAVKIEGIQHEFATIPHVKEDVIEFLLNVKELRLKAFSERSGRLFLEVKGEGTVCAGDIKPSADFEVVNPELHLITLDSPEASLDVVFYVERGKGYVPAGRDDGLPIGVIPVDAIYTPVRRVNYHVEKTRVGQVSNYDRLILEVWTDGTTLPSEALSQSAEILVNHFTLFFDLGKAPVEVEKPQSPLIPPEQYEMPLEQVGLSARTFNSLRRSGITKVGELLERSDEDLLGLRSFGQKSLDEVKERLTVLDIKPIPQEVVETPEEGVEDVIEEAEDEDNLGINEEAEA
ncbi:MAG: DNA-directed RNA polymerase subunit alpha [Dehalococcoidia bacterium]|nr:MAG: DNA-directed RNA polymerase subunit alpha [Dehalococcoidia bacterium]